MEKNCVAAKYYLRSPFNSQETLYFPAFTASVREIPFASSQQRRVQICCFKSLETKQSPANTRSSHQHQLEDSSRITLHCKKKGLMPVQTYQLRLNAFLRFRQPGQAFGKLPQTNCHINILPRVPSSKSNEQKSARQVSYAIPK